MYKINELALIITTILVIILLFIYSNMSMAQEYDYNENTKKDYYEYMNKATIRLYEKYSNITQKIKCEKSVDKEWRIEISSIKLNAKISEGTDSKILNKYVGHFENTKKENGNIGLAAHNRGYKVNYFQNVKNLKIGDKINYFYNGKKYIYEVYTNHIILDTDWSVLEDNNENEVTLITCVENEEELRRCVKARLID